MNKGLIYKVKCKINGKCYIGQTTLSIEKRKKQHTYYALNNIVNTHFYNALKKYGLENFKWNIIEDNILESKLNEKEIYYINNQNTFLNGYNMTEGGSISPMRYKKTRKKISGENHWTKRLSITEETKQKISKSIKNLWKNDEYRKEMTMKTKMAMMNPNIREKLRKANTGKKLSEETRKRMSKSKSKEYIIYSPENKELYIKNLKLFCKENNLSYTYMNRIANGLNKYHKGWKCSKREQK